MAVPNATPLIALDALVIDTETTGLDAAKARVVEIGALPLKTGVVDEARSFRVLINPGEAIPKVAMQVHGIGDTAVVDAPSFAQVWKEFSLRLEGTVVVGHTIGFDLAVLRRECARAGMRWQPPRALCTRLLAQAVAPTLGSYSLENLADWLEVELTGRHSALGDAGTTARIFLALLPKLRERNIRTLAEAEQACRDMSAPVEREQLAGWVVSEGPSQRTAETALGRIDTYPYRHRAADVMSAPARLVGPAMPLAQALKVMSDEKISSVLVGDTPRAADAAIVTERDVLRTVAHHGAAALARPVADFASRPLAAVPDGAFVYRALGRMARLKLRHLAVVNDNGAVVGMISARDLLRLNSRNATILGDGIDQAETVPQLAAAWALLPHAAAALIAEGVGGRDIAAVISGELWSLTHRASVLAERQLAAAGHGPPPCRYAMCVLGSAGRGESLLAMDQDNAIVFAHGAPGETEDAWFAQLGIRVADILHEVGVPYCKGGVMARNEQWRGSIETWRSRINAWIVRSNPRDLLSVDIFFDLVGVHGDLALANEIWRYGFDVAEGNASFAKLLAEAAGEAESGLTFLGGFATENGRIDLKRTGLFGIVTTARVLAIRHHILERSTPARLAGLAALDKGTSDLEALSDAHAVFVDLILAQQIADIEAGRSPSNKVEIRKLSRTQRARLKDALRANVHLDALSRDLLF
jgi:DNA polymerase-3 subunit epsilon/CBS domain-containing protein